MHDIGLDQILDAIGELYAAAHGDIGWATAVETLRRLFRASSASFGRHGPPAGDGDRSAAEANPVLYADGLFCRIWEHDSSVWVLDVRRQPQQEKFGQAEIALLRQLQPHLRRAAAIAHRRQMAEALISAYAQLPLGVLLLAPDQRIIRANEYARKLLAQPGSCLHIEAERLACAAQHAAALRRLIDGARQAPAQPSAGLLLRQPAASEATQDLMISVLPVDDGTADDATRAPCVAILLREAHAHLPESFDSHLRSAFNLTPAEARLAATLCAGQSLKAAAALQDIRFSTARHYLEKIFQKTGTSQQSQLVSLLMCLQPLLWM